VSENTHADPLGQALELAFRFLNRRDRTVSEVREHLAAREVAEPVAEAAIAELRDTGYLDDVRYTRLFTEDKRTLEQWGSGRIRRTLLGRGIERELMDQALADADANSNVEADAWADADPANPDGDSGPRDELGRALDLLRRRFPVAPQDRRERDRALGMLLRKGYESELAVEAVAAYARGSGGWEG
jgi:regulatory protein